MTGELNLRRFIEDKGQKGITGYHNGKELHDVFDEIGADIYRLSPNKWLVIGIDEILIYERPKASPKKSSETT